MPDELELLADVLELDDEELVEDDELLDDDELPEELEEPGVPAFPPQPASTKAAKAGMSHRQY